MNKKNIVVLFISAIAFTGCAGMNRQIEETKARGTIEAGGYTWEIPADSAGGNTIRTQGIPGRQAATDASSTLCKKYGRVAQYVKHRNLLLTGTAIFDFNCVR